MASFTLWIVVSLLVAWAGSEDTPLEDQIALESRKDSYRYGYYVSSPEEGNQFSHQQQIDEGQTNGEYRIYLPDGRWQIVSYVADEEGYRATVRYESADAQQAHETAWGFVPSLSPPQKPDQETIQSLSETPQYSVTRPSSTRKYREEVYVPKPDSAVKESEHTRLSHPGTVVDQRDPGYPQDSKRPNRDEPSTFASAMINSSPTLNVPPKPIPSRDLPERAAPTPVHLANLYPTVRPNQHPYERPPSTDQPYRQSRWRFPDDDPSSSNPYLPIRHQVNTFILHPSPYDPTTRPVKKPSPVPDRINQQQTTPVEPAAKPVESELEPHQVILNQQYRPLDPGTKPFYAKNEYSTTRRPTPSFIQDLRSQPESYNQPHIPRPPIYKEAAQLLYGLAFIGNESKPQYPSSEFVFHSPMTEFKPIDNSYRPVNYVQNARPVPELTENRVPLSADVKQVYEPAKNRYEPLPPEYDPPKIQIPPVKPSYEPLKPLYDSQKPISGPSTLNYEPIKSPYESPRPNLEPVKPLYEFPKRPYEPINLIYDPLKPPYEPNRPDYRPQKPDFNPFKPKYEPISHSYHQRPPGGHLPPYNDFGPLNVPEPHSPTGPSSTSYQHFSIGHVTPKPYFKPSRPLPITPHDQIPKPVYSPKPQSYYSSLEPIPPRNNEFDYLHNIQQLYPLVRPIYNQYAADAVYNHGFKPIPNPVYPIREQYQIPKPPPHPIAEPIYPVKYPVIDPFTEAPPADYKPTPIVLDETLEGEAPTEAPIPEEESENPPPTPVSEPAVIEAITSSAPPPAADPKPQRIRLDKKRPFNFIPKGPFPSPSPRPKQNESDISPLFIRYPLKKPKFHSFGQRIRPLKRPQNSSQSPLEPVEGDALIENEEEPNSSAAIVFPNEDVQRIVTLPRPDTDSNFDAEGLPKIEEEETDVRRPQVLFEFDPMPIIRNRGVPIFDPKESENQAEEFTFAPLPPREREPSSTFAPPTDPHQNFQSATEKHSEEMSFTSSPFREFQLENLPLTTVVTESHTTAKSATVPIPEAATEAPTTTTAATTTTTTVKPTPTTRFRFALNRKNRTTLRPAVKSGTAVVLVNNSSDTEAVTEKSKGNRVRFPPRIRFVQKSDRFVRQNPVDIDIMDLLKFSALHEDSGFELVLEPEASSSEIDEMIRLHDDDHPETNLVPDPEFRHSAESVDSWESLKTSPKQEHSKATNHASRNDDLDTISHWTIDGLLVDASEVQSESLTSKNRLSDFVQLASSESSPEKSHVITSSPVSLLLPESVS